jgi:hypothetical protein
MGRWAVARPAEDWQVNTPAPRAFRERKPPAYFRERQVNSRRTFYDRQERLVRKIIAFSIMIVAGLASGWMVGGAIDRVLDRPSAVAPAPAEQNASPAVEQKPQAVDGPEAAVEQAGSVNPDYANQARASSRGERDPKRDKAFKKMLRHLEKANPTRLPQGIAKLKIW